MSVDATVWAWKQCITPIQKLVLLSLADGADETHAANVDLLRLTAETCLTRNVAITAIHALESRGLIRRIYRDRDQRWLYQLVGVADRHGLVTKPVLTLIPGGAP